MVICQCGCEFFLLVSLLTSPSSFACSCLHLATLKWNSRLGRLDYVRLTKHLCHETEDARPNISQWPNCATSLRSCKRALRSRSIFTCDPRAHTMSPQSLSRVSHSWVGECRPLSFLWRDAAIRWNGWKLVGEAVPLNTLCSRTARLSLLLRLKSKKNTNARVFSCLMMPPLPGPLERLNRKTVPFKRTSVWSGLSRLSRSPFAFIVGYGLSTLPSCGRSSMF